MPSTNKYEDIIEVVNTKDEETTNKYLKLGWTMLNVESHQYAEHGWSTAFSLGWKASKGEIKRPEIKKFDFGEFDDDIAL
ncbi:hypothetical protein [Oceanospirillum sp.]|uniref:hypothetical protein n=1 Tax=Oceanospirillum sp. TaxID=2021254 RepID=UPI003A8ECF35